MSTFHGTFVWFELMTTDTKAAEKFYRDVVGWSTQDAGIPGISYTLFKVAETMVAGLMETPDHVKDMLPSWSGYIAVDDVDAAAARLQQEGGVIHRAPTDIPGVGRFAFVADPQGAMFAVFKGTADEPPRAPPGNTPGFIGWHELYATAWEPMFGFYSKLFGWTKDKPFDMGPMGIYQLFARGGVAMGGMMTKPPAIPAPYWNFYFNVAAIDAAAACVTKGGGQILNGPLQVPTGEWIVQGRDPQGATFALLGPKT